MSQYIYFCEEKFSSLPCRKAIIQIIKDIRSLIFPGYFDCLEKIGGQESLRQKIQKELEEQIRCAGIVSKKEVDARESSGRFIASLDEIVDMLKKDLEATYEGDPAASDYHEIILSYPGSFAISVYRIAHALYRMGIPYIPRIMSEYAHSKTGIDIHPGAEIGESFFIDHGTGIVIGETTKIGHHVRIYQGVTLGALSLGRGQQLKGVKRHPTIGNYVTIYAGASILGGDTVIGDHCIIGSNTYILESVPRNTVVRLTKVDMEKISR